MTPAEPPDSYFHIRRLNPRRDLNAVADLVEAAFELKNDPEGAWVLRQMRAYARRAQSYPDIITLSGAPEGFVWEENGKIVGNISIVSYPRPEARIVLIANVAVASEYRRRGIASALTRHALRYISQWPRAEVWLQVRSENQAAIQMYHQLGFEFIYALSQWRYSPAQRLTASPRAGFPRELHVGARRLADWKTQARWLAINYPRQTRWYLNANLDAFSPWSFLIPARWQALLALSHLALRDDRQLLGVLTCQKTRLSSDLVWLALPDEPGEDMRADMLLSALLKKEEPVRPLSLEYPLGRAQLGIQSAGFTLARNLDWMKLRSL
ncbi:MAG: GNAT family N-acetyltransferase [Chloroflexi bacterium]|jgi:ribosomal protein S18 acetylase RimI-like enzyme|nr:GNAT family N-acetyltransferase [Chloroflexota bacterium]HOE35188.1 GNAT family N-acetyltransferase [Anaerolineaceae bacterium]HOT26116.1 GNAT family N-acetyltransferase [Anaerolineaceae bacterium]HQH58344.1 GNAT family N-acetyltransferase [Anaerolineaceae bacterium]HQK04249.1 GNAT family N-acetyltransferase [Anaerolineaceae bacterium]